MNIDFSIKIKDFLFKDFANLTLGFFLMLCKVNGDNYPIVSVMNMYDSFNRLLKVIYEKQICESNFIELEFCMKIYSQWWCK
jgi:hypothetical protein